MLTVDLVRAFRRKGELKLSELKPADRARAVETAGRYLAITKAHIGQTRGALLEALAGVPFSARDKKLCGGLRKLILDRCEFEASSEHDPVAIRRAVFARAGQVRQQAVSSEQFDRQQILATTAAALNIAPDGPDDTERAGQKSTQVPGEASGETSGELSGELARAQALERLLYADLKHAHRLLRFAALAPEVLVVSYCDGQAQAVLLRARRVTVRVSGQPSDMRALFRKLKFLRLLYTIERLPPDVSAESGAAQWKETSYRLIIDGPYSLFRSVTKYGLGMALMLPALRVCERWSLEADVEWGKQRELLRFSLMSETSAADRSPDGADSRSRLPDEVASLLDKFAKRFEGGKTAWKATVASDILTLPGAGLCVPDLMFVHSETGECVYLEVMGFWSRDAVWRRVELVEQGLPQAIVFAVSSRLRVSEAALGPDLPGALYVYKGAMSVRAIEERLERVRSAG